MSDQLRDENREAAIERATERLDDELREAFAALADNAPHPLSALLNHLHIAMWAARGSDRKLGLWVRALGRVYAETWLPDWGRERAEADAEADREVREEARGEE